MFTCENTKWIAIGPGHHLFEVGAHVIKLVPRPAGLPSRLLVHHICAFRVVPALHGVGIVDNAGSVQVSCNAVRDIYFDDTSHYLPFHVCAYLDTKYG